MFKNNYTEVELLQGLAVGDKSVISAIYQTYRPILTKWIVSHGGLDSEADDIFQEALIIMYEKAKNPEFCLTCQVGTYIFAISKRLWLKKINRSGKSISFEEEIGDDEDDQTRNPFNYDEDMTDYWAEELKFDRLNEAMNRLGDPCNKLLHAFYIQNKSMQEIAADFGYTNAENAKTQKYKCLTRLKKLYFELEKKLNN